MRDLGILSSHEDKCGSRFCSAPRGVRIARSATRRLCALRHARDRRRVLVT